MGEIVSQGLGISIRLDDHSPEVKEALKNAIERGLWSIGATAEGYAKDVITEAGRVDTGRMRASVSHMEGDNFTAIGTNVEYAPYHEMGTSRGIKAIHFLRRAATEHTDEYKQLMQESLENA